MYQTISRIIIVLTVSFGLVACATTHLREQKLIDQGATRLNGEQARQHLSGKTQEWTAGGAYFHPDGMVDVKWEGKVYPARTWTVEDDGEVCISNPDGVVSSCSVYYDDNGKIWFLTLEIFGEAQTNRGGPDIVHQGNKLSEMY